MEKIAIIGLSCLFPLAHNPEQFWQNLVEEKDSRSFVTAEEMGVDPMRFYDPVKGKPDKTYCLKGGYIRDFNFDPTGYTLSPEFIAELDSLFKWSLYVAKQALQNSGYSKDEAVLSRCGVILGNYSFATKSSHRLFRPIYHKAIESAVRELLQQEHFSLSDLSEFNKVSTHNALISGYPAAIVAQALSLSGINFSLDAACASSLYAVKLACHYLLSSKADLMLAGGVNCADPLSISLGFSSFQAYPENGISQPFDKSSLGLMTGEGAGMIVLKRYSDAIRDGDKIYATIRGIGLSNDGRGKHLLSPNQKGQILAFERAYTDAEINPKSIDYVECHATGTPLGDTAELNSMDAFFGQYEAAPLVGSVKSNLGHLMTVAGIASIIKVVLSMSKELIPATIRLMDPICSQNNIFTDSQIVSSVVPWPIKVSTKLAGVSAFGFGGTNAHLILESEAQLSASLDSQCAPVQLGKMAIVGMDTFWGSCNGLDAFERSIYEGMQHFIPLPKDRWKGIEEQQQLLKEYGFENGEIPLGSYIKDFEIDVFNSKLPPDKADKLNPQHLLMLLVADKAVRDAKLDEGENVAVIIAMETELSIHKIPGRCDLSGKLKDSLTSANIALLPEQISELEDIVKDSIAPSPQASVFLSYIGNIMASRISALWDFSGPSFTVSAEENSVFKALEVAQMLLTAREVDAVVVGAVDLAGGVENVLLRNQLHKVNTGTNTLSYDRNTNGWIVGEGAGAVVLKLHEKAKQVNDRIYAVIDAIGLVQSVATETDNFQEPPAITAVTQACQQAFIEAGIKPVDIGYLEVFGSGIDQEDEAEISGLTLAYQTPQPELTCAIGSVKANIGHTYAASGMASLIKTALCLYHRYIPVTPHWSGPKRPEAWQGSPFYVATESNPWFLEEGVSKRVAAINGLGRDGTYAHLILSEEPSQKDRSSRYLEQTPFYLFPLAAESRQAILSQLGVLQHTLKNCSSPATAASQAFEAYSAHPQATYVLAIVGHNKDELLQEIQRALKGVAKTFDEGGDWKTPLGSYFTARPLGKQQSAIAFVYPGAFTSYVGLCRDIYHLFPKSYDSTARLASSQDLSKHLIAGSIVDKLLYPRSLDRLAKQQLEALEMQLTDDVTKMLLSGTTAATVFTMIMRDYFRVQPASAFGYSLGEFSMMFALNVWSGADKIADRLHSSPFFTTRLSGPKNAVREYWGLPQSQEHAGEDFWSSYVLMTSASEVMESLKNENRVYLTHINTPEEVVIAGDTQGCLRVIKNLKCDYFRTPFSDVIHCPPLNSEFDEFAKWFTLPVQNVPEVDFYSAANYRNATLDSKQIGHSIAKTLCKHLDFPRLINQVYEDGARIFIEIGPGGTCSRWIRETLKQKEHVAMFINSRGVDDHTSIVRVLAKLLSHQVPMDISPLYGQAEETPVKNKSLVKTVTLGGCRISSTILTEENRKNFANLQPQEPVDQEPLKDAVENYQYIPSPVTEMREQVCAEVSPEKHSIHCQKLSENTSRCYQTDAAFLQARQDSLRLLSEMIQLQIAVSQRMLDHSPPVPPYPQRGPRVPPAPLFDEADVLEFAEGKISRVFGKEYEIIDSYSRRVRLPMPPYLFVSRVTKLEAKRGCYYPASIQTEYDILQNAWCVDSQISVAVAIEASQGVMFLISYLGVDFENKGHRVYRAIDGDITFLDELPKDGETLLCDVKINSFTKVGDSLLFFYTYECFVGGKKILRLNGSGGLFSDEELRKGQGITLSNREKEKRSLIQKQHFKSLLLCHKTAFDEEDLQHLSEGNIAACFGGHYEQHGMNRSLRLPPKPIRMLDRVIFVDPEGGDWGLGLVIAEKFLEPEHWYFNCHFKDDLCMPGTFIGESFAQVLKFYMLYLGLQTSTVDARFQPIPHLTQAGRSRGQITPVSDILTYHLQVTEIGLVPTSFVKGDASVVFDGKTIAIVKNLGIQLSEKNP